METKQEREARLRRMADIGRAHIVRYRETGEGKPIPPPKPWLYAPKPTECGKCQADAAANLVRINVLPGDGWRCLRCGWNVYDPAQDVPLPVDDQCAIANADGPAR